MFGLPRKDDYKMPEYLVERAVGFIGGGGLILPRLFNSDECAKIIRLVHKEDDFEPGMMGRKGSIGAHRRSRIFWLRDRIKWRWVYKRIHGTICKVNLRTWCFDLSYEEDMQYSWYDYTEKGQYDWHVDLLPNDKFDRKLSISVQLSSSESYAGGDLVLFPDFFAPRAQGSATIFPSYVNHRVTPVDSGERHSLVGWVRGPLWR